MCAARENSVVNSGVYRQWRPRHSARVLPEEGFRCPVCPTVYIGTKERWEEHLTCSLHRYNYYCAVFQNNRDHKAQDRHGVTVRTHCGTEEVIYNERDGTVKSVISPEKSDVIYEFEVINNSSHGITLCDVYLLHPYPVFQIHEDDNFINTKRRVLILPGASCSLRICFTNTGVGSYGVPIAFNLFTSEPGRKSKTFDIVRVMVINVVGPDHIPTKRKSESPFTGEDWDDVTVTILSVAEGRARRRITGYCVTQEHKMMFDNWLGPYQGLSDEALEDLYYVMMAITQGYSVLKDCYHVFFHTMLYLEEYDANGSIISYNMTNAQLRLIGSGRQIELEVPGLSEKRPPVVKGDLIYVRIRHLHGPREHVAYEGVITHLFESGLWMSGFSSEFYERFGYQYITYDIHFTFPRFPMYVMHRAIDLAMKNGLLEVLFPNDNEEGLSLYTPLFEMSADELYLFNEEIASNSEQVSAVINIIQGAYRPAPYIIFGPPGTGKTVTIVESVLQIKELFPHSRILVCATSNAACDVLAKKLFIHCNEQDIFRVYSFSTEWSTVPESIYKSTNRRESMYYFPRPEMVAKYRIVICTLVTASRLIVEPHATWYPQFTHIFIDECGQAHEPEALAAMGGILGVAYKNDIGGQLILAGDPQQLGPICHSFRAQHIRSVQGVGGIIGMDEIDNRIGLGVSLLERLMSTNKLYQKNSDGSYDNRFITKLLCNYRSHPGILELPNKLFYGDELIYACPEKIMNDPILDFPLFGKGKKLRKLSPLVFHGVIGHELKEGEAPSFFNAFEVDQVVIYLERLLDSHLITQKDVGIISPYIRQVYKIKQKLEEKGWRKVEVGSTESFQGREKRIVIVSLVRGNKNLLDLDCKYQLGFLNNPRRFNVALTRAKSLLIVIGNPFVVGSDPKWLQLIHHCRVKGSYTGCAFQVRDSQWIRIVNQKMDKLEIE